MPQTQNNNRNSERRRQQAMESVAQIAAMGGKMPPNVVEFEEAVLGALLIQQDTFQEVSEILKAEHFYVEANKKVYSAIETLAMQNNPVDLLTVTHELERTGDLDAVGGRIYLTKLTTKVASAINIAYHARIIFQKYLQRSMIEIGTIMQSDAYDDSIDVDELLENSESKLFELSQGSMKKEVVQINPIIEEAVRQMHEASKRADGLSGIPSGFAGIDRVTAGWQPATMVVIAARPAMGKTAFVLSMARKMAVDYNLPIAIFSLEMSNVELVKRLISAETEIRSDKIKTGRLDTDEWRVFNERIGKLMQAPIYVDDTPGLSIFDLRTKARILHKKNGIKAIIIDYLQLMNASAMRPGSRQEEVSMISRNLKGLAKELNIPVIALSQLNRGVETRGGEGIDGKRPQLADLRESGAIEQDADMVCFIHRPEYYGIREDKDGNSLVGVAQFIIAKHRSGAVEDVNLRFQADLVRFQDADIPFSGYGGGSETGYATYTSKINNSPAAEPNLPDIKTDKGEGLPF